MITTGIYVQVNLHPFYQQFLRNHYQEFEPVFKFPEKDKFMMWIEDHLILQPDETAPITISKKNIFRIEIPSMSEKDPFYYNHLSKRSLVKFDIRIRLYVNHIVFDEVYRFRKKGYFRNEILNLIIEKYQISYDYEDLITKQYNRAIDAARIQIYRKRKKRLENA